MELLRQESAYKVVPEILVDFVEDEHVDFQNWRNGLESLDSVNSEHVDFLGFDAFHLSVVQNFIDPANQRKFGLKHCWLRD